jgi:hypothetical protein
MRTDSNSETVRVQEINLRFADRSQCTLLISQPSPQIPNLSINNVLKLKPE